MDNNNSMYLENKVTMTLEEFLAFRDGLRKWMELKEFALDCRCSYDENKRDAHEIGWRALSMMNLSTDIKEDDK